jgi:nitroreductase
METWDAIRARRNVRSYQTDAVPAVWRGAGHIAGAAAAIALVVPRTDDDRTRLLDYYDLGQATYAMALAAADLGIGTGHASVGDQDQARTILGVPADRDVAFLVGIGYPADRPLRPIAKPNRRPLGEVIHHGHW